MSALIDALSTRDRLPVVDTAGIEAFLAPAPGEAAHALLFFTGDPQKRAEANDVAVVLPQLLTTFAPHLRAAVVARSAETALARRFQVQVYPSLVLVRGAAPLCVMPRIRDWADYVATIRTSLLPGARPLPDAPPPRVEFRYTGKNGRAA